MSSIVREQRANRRSLTIRKFRKNLADHPSSSKVVGIACSGKGGFASRPTQGLPPYQIDRCIADDTAIFVESAPMAGYRILRNTIGMSAIAMAITAIPVAWLFGTGVSFGDLLSGLLLVASIGTLVAAMVLWIALISWNLTVWPIAIEQRNGACVIRLAGRKPWSWMQDLSPMLAVGELDFVHNINSRKPMKADSLPRRLSRCKHAVWLRLAWQRRVRWVILDMHKNEEDALVGMAEWADRLGINLEKSVCSDPAPRLAYLYRDVKPF